MAMNAREAAYTTLLRFDRDGAYINHALNEIFNKNRFSDTDRGFAAELVYGCLKGRNRLDYIISRFSKVKLKKMSKQVRIILELGTYQIMFMDRVPDSAACDESVKLASSHAYRSRGFVNGVLRGICRGKKNIKYPNPENRAEYLSVMLSFPKWIVDRLTNDYGAEKCEMILSAANRAYPPYIRKNPLREPLDFLSTLSADGIEAEKDGEIEGCYRVNGSLDISRSNTYKNGLFTLQNRSSQMAALTLDPKPGQFVIDMCAAPGGKTTHMAELMKNKGEIRAFDIHEHKISLINAAAKRLGIDIIEAQTRDAAVPAAELLGKADKVLLDAPCSGLGVIHTKPDIRWSRKEEDIAELVDIQSKLLDAASSYLKPGGHMVYSTCTILKDENERQIEKFLKKHSEFKLVSEETLLTHETGGSGFYIAKLKKEDNFRTRIISDGEK